jgi:hypothetical protein
MKTHIHRCILKSNNCPKFYIGQTGRSFKTQYTEHVKALTQPLIKSNFAEHIFSIHHTYTNIETNLENLHILPKGPRRNTTEKYEVYKHYKQSLTNILNNDQIHYKSHTHFDTIKHTNISAILTAINRKTNFTADSSPGPSDIDNNAHDIEKLLLKTQVSEKFLHSEVK